MKIVDLLAWCRRITDAFQKQAGENWVMEDQSLNVEEEVGEFLAAIDAFEKAPVQDSVEYLRLWDEIGNEGIDLIMSTITAFHIVGYSDKEIWDALRRVMSKLEGRVKSGYYEKGEHIEHWELWKE